MELRTERLILRDFVFADWRAVLAYQSHPDYLHNYAWETRTAEDAQAFVQRFLAQQQAQPRICFQLAITDKVTGTLMGNCGLRLEMAEDQMADIGYELDPAYWGQGYATEAATALVQFGFTQLHLHRIWATCYEENEASARVLTKLGMQREGRLREVEYFKGRWHNTLLFAILADAWQKKGGRNGCYR